MEEFRPSRRKPKRNLTLFALGWRAIPHDPTVNTKPWTVEISMSKRTDRLF